MTELKPCECGGQALPTLYSFGEWNVICLNPECENETKMCKTRAEAIEAWNRRIEG